MAIAGRCVWCVSGGLPICNIRLNSVKHVHCSFVNFQKDPVKDLQESQMKTSNQNIEEVETLKI